MILFLTRLRRSWLAIFSALMLCLALPNPIISEGLGILGFILLVPLFVSLYSVDLLRWHLFYSFLFGFVYCLVSNFWLFYYENFAWITLGSVSISVGLLTMVLGVYIFFFHHFDPYFRPLFVAMTWSFYEIGKSNGFLGFPWGLIAYTPHKWTLLTQILDLVGISGLSFIMVLPNAILAEYICNSHKKTGKEWKTFYLFFYSILIGSTLIYGMFATTFQNKKLTSSSTVSLLLIQQNSDPWKPKIQNFQLYQETVLQKIEENPQRKFDLIVGSEGILTYKYNPENKTFNDPTTKLKDFIKKVNMPQILGGAISDSTKNQDQNGTLFIVPSGEVIQYYAKRQMVPFAEYNPLLKHSWIYWFFDRIVHYPFTWVPGEKNTLFDLNLSHENRVIRIGTPICFEDTFGWVSREQTLRGADLLVNVTDDSWSQVITAEVQHLIAAKYRTIENRRPLVRATTSGITAYLDIFGRTIASLPPFTQNTLEVNVKIPKNPQTTLYTKTGDWLAISFAIFVNIYLLWWNYKRKNLRYYL